MASSSKASSVRRRYVEESAKRRALEPLKSISYSIKIENPDSLSSVINRPPYD